MWNSLVIGLLLPLMVSGNSQSAIVFDVQLLAHIERAAVVVEVNES